jgi:outer membrane protein assembly factor BamB
MMSLRLNLIFIICILFSFVLGEDFSQWRGPHRDGKYPDKNLLKEWPVGGPPLIWSVDNLGAGHSSVALANKHVYVTGMPGNTGVLYAFNLDGVLQWKKSYGIEWTRNYPGTRSTPTVIGDHLYVMSGLGRVVCLNALSGKEIWAVELFKRFSAENIEWGLAESVLIDGNHVFCTPGGPRANVVALNRFNGKSIWTSVGYGEPAAYCSPQLVEHYDARLIVTMTAESIIALDANDGTPYWRAPQYQEYKIHANTPLYHDGKIFFASASNRNSGSVLLELSQDGKDAKKIWRNEGFDNLMGGNILLDGYIYGSRYHRNEWYCLDWRNGESQYVFTDLDGGVVIWADGLFYCYSRAGEMALVKADSEEFKIVSSFKIRRGTGQHWAHPVIAEGRLYIRHGDALMVYDISQ